MKIGQYFQDIQYVFFPSVWNTNVNLSLIKSTFFIFLTHSLSLSIIVHSHTIPAVSARFTSHILYVQEVVTLQKKYLIYLHQKI